MRKDAASISPVSSAARACCRFGARQHRETKKAPASLYPGASSLLIGESLRNRSPRRSDSYPKAKITLMAVQKMQVVVQKMQVEIKTKLVTFVTDNVLLVGIVGNKNLLARMLQDKER